MADRVSVAIRIGGRLTRALFGELEAAITSDDAATDWEGTPFSIEDLPIDAPLALMANEVAWGRFDEIEAFCHQNDLMFARWAGGCSGSFGPERVVFDGKSERTFAVTDDDEVMISRDDVRRLGTIEAIEVHFADADFAVPPLILLDDTPSAESGHG